MCMYTCSMFHLQSQCLAPFRNSLPGILRDTMDLPSAFACILLVYVLAEPQWLLMNYSDYSYRLKNSVYLVYPVGESGPSGLTE